LPPPLQIVVTCTKRKTQPIPAALKVRSLCKDTVLHRSAEWMQRLSAAKEERITAGDIYCGDHWQTVKALVPTAEASGYKANIWICSLFSAGTKSLPGLTEYLLPLNARLQGMAGGARRSLNIRLARHALLKLRKTGTEHSSLKSAFDKLSATQPALVAPTRTRMTDQDVELFIVTALQKDPRRTFSPLLRELRHQGFACESGRFASLFHNVQERIHES
jgi:hypothetical protein